MNAWQYFTQSAQNRTFKDKSYQAESIKIFLKNQLTFQVLSGQKEKNKSDFYLAHSIIQITEEQ